MCGCRHRGLGALPRLVMHAAIKTLAHSQGNGMAEEEPLLTSPPTQDAAAHVRDYTAFTKLLKWTAIVCFIIAMLVMMIIS